MAEDQIQNKLDDEDDARVANLTEHELNVRAERIPPEYAVWMLRNVCPLEECGGTLAPPNQRATHMTCNACGHKRTDEAFFAALQEGG